MLHIQIQEREIESPGKALGDRLNRASRPTKGRKNRYPRAIGCKIEPGVPDFRSHMRKTSRPSPWADGLAGKLNEVVDRQLTNGHDLLGATLGHGYLQHRPIDGRRKVLTHAHVRKLAKDLKKCTLRQFLRFCWIASQSQTKGINSGFVLVE